jgi:transcriptional regulator with XRE-family HTH domain
MTVERKAIRILLAGLDIHQNQLAELMGYKRGYVINVLNGHASVSSEFRIAFGDTIARLLLGEPCPKAGLYPPGPLVELMQRRAAEALSVSEFYDELQIQPCDLNGRDVVSERVVDRVCCALGVHPSAIYGSNGEAS